MRCSECSEVVKPVVAIDIDGTLGDYHTHFINFLRGYSNHHKAWYDVHGYSYDGSIPFSEWCMNMYGIDLHMFRAAKLAYRQGGMKRSMPVYSSVDDVVRNLKKLGIEIWLTTTRPYLRLDGIDPDTRFWLDVNYITYNGLLYDEDKYKVLAERIDPGRVIAVLDDLPEQYDAACEAFGTRVPILRGTKYNRAVERPSKTQSLSAAGLMIKNRWREWEALNG